MTNTRKNFALVAAAVFLTNAGAVSARGPLATRLAPRTSQTAAAAGASQRPAYLDPALPIDRRVEDLVSRMTVEEKASQFTNTSAAIPRLGVPAYDWWSEGLHGVGFDGIATVFPQAIGLAASFDTALIHDVATAISTEGR